MSRHIAKIAAAAVVTFAVAIGIYVLSFPRLTSNAQDRAGDLQGLLERLVDEDIPFVITFVTPVAEGRSYWRIPGDIEDEGNVIARRFVREIGDNYICVDEIGQGATTAICVPFTNIAYITFTS